MQTKKYVLRFSFVFLGLIICLITFCIKLILIQIFQSSHLSKLAEKQHRYLVEIEPVRGTIYDRNLRPLAFNVFVPSLFANPKTMSANDKEKAISELSVLLNLNHQYIKERLDKEKYFIWLKRKFSPELSEKIKNLDIKGLGLRKESRRFYPNGSLAAHVIGFAGIDNKGLEGLEMYYDNILKGKSGQMYVLRDARQKELLVEEGYLPPQDGFNLVLTIDETIQYVAEVALEKAFKKHNAKSATVIVMDVKTGEILALANRPTYNISEVGTSSPESRTNRAIVYIYEPGSVFKIVTAAAALEENLFKETDKVFCENGKYRVANNILHDHGSHGTLSFREVFEKSSNIGVTKIAQKIGTNNVYKYAAKLRFGKKTGIDLNGEIQGVLKHPSKWSKTSIGAIPIGHEVLVTPMQLVCALGAIANNGVYMKPHIVKYIKDNNDNIIKSFGPQVVDKVITDQTAIRLKEILKGAVEKGTGKAAKIKGINVGGKTGTAQKVENGAYTHNKFYASFIGFAPVEDPRLAVVAVFDEPHPSYFGGTVAAPVVKEIIENSLKYLENIQK